MAELSIEIGSKDDLDLLAALNKQLIEDEMHDNPMNLEQLKARMEGFINSDYRAYLFKENNEIKGYALVHLTREPIYLKQFFICRDCRRKGYGRRAFEKLMQLLGTEQIDIEVMYWNKRGYEFWKSMGFAERSLYMRLEKQGDRATR